MTLEWIRRRDARFDEHLRAFLFREGPIAEHEGEESGEEAEAQGRPTRADAGLGIGSLKERPGPEEETTE
jgi:hypothetical protein